MSRSNAKTRNKINKDASNKRKAAKATINANKSKTSARNSLAMAKKIEPTKAGKERIQGKIEQQERRVRSARATIKRTAPAKGGKGQGSRRKKK